jgi:hypothetical protein
MTDEITLIKNRQSRLEDRVTKLEGSVAAESIARASMEDDLQGMNGDLNGVRAAQKMVRALVASSGEHGRQLRTLDKKVAGVGERLDTMDRRFERRLEGLEISVNNRFDAVDARFDEVERRFAGVDARFDSLQADVRAILDRLGPPLSDDDRRK